MRKKGQGALPPGPPRRAPHAPRVTDKSSEPLFWQRLKEGVNEAFMTVRAAPLLKPLKSSGAWGPVPSLVQGQSPWHYGFTTAPAYGRGSSGAAAAPQPAMACARNHAGRVGLSESGDGHRPGASVGCGAAHPTHELCNEMSAGRQPVGGPRRNVTKKRRSGGHAMARARRLVPP